MVISTYLSDKSNFKTDKMYKRKGEIDPTLAQKHLCGSTIYNRMAGILTYTIKFLQNIRIVILVDNIHNNNTSTEINKLEIY